MTTNITLRIESKKETGNERMAFALLCLAYFLSLFSRARALSLSLLSLHPYTFASILQCNETYTRSHTHTHTHTQTDRHTLMQRARKTKEQDEKIALTDKHMHC